MVSKLFWAALFLTPTVLGAALPEVQENALDLGRRDDVDFAAALPLVARADPNVAVVDPATQPENVDTDADVTDADKKKKKHGHKKGKKHGHKGKKHGHKKGKKHGHKKGPHDLEARDEVETRDAAEQVVADDVDSEADVADADKKKKKHGHKKGKKHGHKGKKHGHKKGKKHGHKKGPHDLEARDEIEVRDVAEEVVADDVDSEADVADADKKKKHGHKKGKKHGNKKGKKHGHKKGKKHGHKKVPPS